MGQWVDVDVWVSGRFSYKGGYVSKEVCCLGQSHKCRAANPQGHQGQVKRWDDVCGTLLPQSVQLGLLLRARKLL